MSTLPATAISLLLVMINCDGCTTVFRVTNVDNVDAVYQWTIFDMAEEAVETITTSDLPAGKTVLHDLWLPDLGDECFQGSMVVESEQAIEASKVSDCETTSPPEMITLEGTHIALELKNIHFEVLDEPEIWHKKLDLAYEAYANLIRGVPYEGVKITIKEEDLPPNVMGIAGNPILASFHIPA